jgi:hypothetical protein
VGSSLWECRVISGPEVCLHLTAKVALFSLWALPVTGAVDDPWTREILQDEKALWGSLSPDRVLPLGPLPWLH